MDKEVLLLLDVAKKAADAASAPAVRSNGPEVSRCIDVLKKLQSFPVTTQLLATTHVAKLVRQQFMTHRHDKIKAMALYLLETWKKSVSQESNKVYNNSGKETEKKKGCLLLGMRKQCGSVDKKSCLLGVRKQCGGIEKKSHLGVGKQCGGGGGGDEKGYLRNKVRQLLTDALSKVAVDKDVKDDDVRAARDPALVASLVESVMYEKMGPFDGLKKLKYRSILFNLKDPQNPDLRRKVLLGEVKPEKLINMTSQEMASVRRQFGYLLSSRCMRSYGKGQSCSTLQIATSVHLLALRSSSSA